MSRSIYEYAKEIVRVGLDETKKYVDEQLEITAKHIMLRYYKGYNRTTDPLYKKRRYKRTGNFMNNSWFFSHKQNVYGDRQYRYITLHFSPEKMDNIYHDYYGNSVVTSFVFDMNFNGLHGYNIPLRGYRYGKSGTRPQTLYRKAIENNPNLSDEVLQNKMTEHFDKGFDSVLKMIDAEISSQLSGSLWG